MYGAEEGALLSAVCTQRWVIYEKGVICPTALLNPDGECLTLSVVCKPGAWVCHPSRCVRGLMLPSHSRVESFSQQANDHRVIGVIQYVQCHNCVNLEPRFKQVHVCVRLSVQYNSLTESQTEPVWKSPPWFAHYSHDTRCMNCINSSRLRSSWQVIQYLSVYDTTPAHPCYKPRARSTAMPAPYQPCWSICEPR